MRLLLDTHVLLWWLIGSDRLGGNAREAIADLANTVYVSAASIWEIAIKRAQGKLPVPPDVSTWLPAEMTAYSFLAVPITVDHAAAVEHLPPHHRDPFDRLLIAQAQAEQLTLVTSDAAISRYDVALLDAAR